MAGRSRRSAHQHSPTSDEERYVDLVGPNALLFATGVGLHAFGLLVSKTLFKIVCSVCGHSIRRHALENIMKSRDRNGAENNLHKVKIKTEKRLQKLMRDPTLEGRDETKVGRIPEKFASVD
jgi:hypothetical protein